MMVLAMITGIFTGRLDEVILAVTDSAKLAFNLCLGLAGIMTFWLGIMELAQQSGLVQGFARILSPIMKRLFPEVPVEDPAMGAMILNITANMLGLTNAATPFGLKAMQALQKLNQNSNEASNAMCTFLAINTSSVQLIPTTAIAYLAANGAKDPTDIIPSALLATLCSTLVALVTVRVLARLKPFQRTQTIALNTSS